MSYAQFIKLKIADRLSQVAFNECLEILRSFYRAGGGWMPCGCDTHLAAFNTVRDILKEHDFDTIAQDCALDYFNCVARSEIHVPRNINSGDVHA